MDIIANINKNICMYSSNLASESLMIMKERSTNERDQVGSLTRGWVSCHALPMYSTYYETLTIGGKSILIENIV